MTYYSSVYDVLFFRISLFFVLLYYLKSASCKCVFFRTRLIQDNNLGQGYGILVPKWLKKTAQNHTFGKRTIGKRKDSGKVRG
jgi:hypothetical protein